jgi:hypothetical protein
VERRLAEVRAEVGSLRELLAVLDAQLAHVDGVAADAGTRAVVEGSPAAQREHRRADGDARRLRRQRDDAKARLDALTVESDELLERLFAAKDREVRS